MSNKDLLDNVKKLRELTGVGFKDCKIAIEENNGDIEASIIWLRKKGVASASKKSSRVASDGLIGTINNTKLCCLCEINTETDFVSRNNEFQELVNSVLKIAIDSKGDDQTIDSCKDLIFSNIVSHILV